MGSLTAGATAVALLTVALVACGGDDTASTTTAAVTTTNTAAPITATTTTTEAEPVSTTSTTPPTTTTEDPGTIIEIVVSGDDVEGDDRYTVALGSEVTISVAADVAEEVHVHGYDLSADIEPGAPVAISFTADIPGIFEVELESSHQLLFELVVTR